MQLARRGKPESTLVVSISSRLSSHSFIHLVPTACSFPSYHEFYSTTIRYDCRRTPFLSTSDCSYCCCCACRAPLSQHRQYFWWDLVIIWRPIGRGRPTREPTAVAHALVLMLLLLLLLMLLLLLLCSTNAKRLSAKMSVHSSVWSVVAFQIGAHTKATYI